MNLRQTTKGALLLTLRLQETSDPQAVVGYPEGILQVLPGTPQQSLPHVHQAGVDGLNDSQEGQTTRPALPKVPHCHAVPTGHSQGSAEEPLRPQWSTSLSRFRSLCFRLQTDSPACSLLHPLQQLPDGLAVFPHGRGRRLSVVRRCAAVGGVRVGAGRDGRQAGGGGELAPDVTSQLLNLEEQTEWEMFSGLTWS